ncbi:hypothetical protein R3P38DRAFT_2526470 [Favolaschia claudopus]|uniref:F-box domain-containing protein n=1 Tax=Favolaschia claudopus TaxID=2862362 RepID=A0AAW0BM22_9AGAR
MSPESLSIPASLVPLFISNDAPHPSQSAVVEEVLRAKQTELSKLEHDIKRVESALNALQTNHDNLQAELDGYKSILSPIRRVPPEVLGEIFLYLVPSADKTHPHCDSLARISLPWKLGQICCRWRAVALSLSELWAFLDLGPFRCLILF